MKRLLLSSAILLMSCGLFLLGHDRAHAVDTIELKLVADYPERHPATVNAIKPWIKSIEEQTAGKVKIIYYPANTLVPQKDGYDSTVSGMVDILFEAALWSNRFPEFEIMSLPFLAPGAEAAGLMISGVMEKFPQIRDRFKDTKFLWVSGSASGELTTAKAQVKSLKDLNGLRIIGFTAVMMDAIKALGANPIELPPPDIYMALQRNTADGVLFPIAPIKAMKISDVAKFHTIVNFNTGVFYAVMNKDKFKTLPPDVQKIIEETTGEKMTRTVGQVLDNGSAQDAKWLKENGHTFFVLPASERELWIEKNKPVIESNLAKYHSKGIANAREIYDEAVRLGKELSKTTGSGYQE